MLINPAGINHVSDRNSFVGENVHMVPSSVQLFGPTFLAYYPQLPPSEHRSDWFFSVNEISLLQETTREFEKLTWYEWVEVLIRLGEPVSPEILSLFRMATIDTTTTPGVIQEPDFGVWSSDIGTAAFTLRRWNVVRRLPEGHTLLRNGWGLLCSGRPFRRRARKKILTPS